MPRYGDLYDLIGFLPQWLGLLIIVLAISWSVSMAGMVLLRTGRSPYLALAAFVCPPLLLIGLWWVALGRWTPPKQPADPETPSAPGEAEPSGTV